MNSRFFHPYRIGRIHSSFERGIFLLLLFSVILLSFFFFKLYADNVD